jgi:hypothetical protein
MGGLPRTLTVEPMKIASDLAIFCDFDGYCSRQWNFAMALNTTFIGWLGTNFPIPKLIILVYVNPVAVLTTEFAFIVSHSHLWWAGNLEVTESWRNLPAATTRPYLYKFAIRLAKY